MFDVLANEKTGLAAQEVAILLEILRYFDEMDGQSAAASWQNSLNSTRVNSSQLAARRCKALAKFKDKGFFPLNRSRKRRRR